MTKANPHIAIDGMLINRCVSGVEHAIYNLAAALADCGACSYDLYMPRYSLQPDIKGPLFQTQRCGPKHPSRMLRILWEQIRLPRLIRQRHADLLHAPGYVAPFHAGVPTVITVYDLIALRWPQYCKRSNVLNYRLQLPLSIRRATGIIVPSEATRQDLIDRFPAAAPKTRVIPLAITDDFHVIDQTDVLDGVRTRYGLPRQFILFVGQLEPKKNVPALIHAFARLRSTTTLPHKLVLAGGQGWEFDAIEKAVALSGVDEDIIFTGFVPEEDLPALFNQADLFVFPSLCEGFGIPPLEAMACGIPVVTSNCTSLPEVVGDAAVLIDNPQDTCELTHAMEQLLTDPTLREDMKAKGLERATLFSWTSTARSVEAFYRDMLRGVSTGS